MDKHSKSSIWWSRNNQNLKKWLNALYWFSSTVNILFPGVQINGIHKRGVHSLSTVLPFNNSGSRLFSRPASGSPVSRDQWPSVRPLRSVVRSLQALLVCVVDRSRVTCGASYWSVFFFVGAVKTLKLHAPFATPVDVDCSGPWTEVTKSKPHSNTVTLQSVGDVRRIIRGAIIVLSPPRLVWRF